MNRLQQVIEQMLGQPGAYDSPLIQQLRESGMHNLEDLRRTEEDRLRGDAASRGVYRGSGLSNSLGDLSERYVRGAQDLEADLLEKAANSHQQGLGQAIQSAFGYEQGQQQYNQQQIQLLTTMAQLGMLGGPNIPDAVGQYGTMPLPTPGDNSWIYQMLGQYATPPKGA
jgi:hypothetical protein